KSVPDEANYQEQVDAEIDMEWPEIEFNNHKVVNGVEFRFKAIPALDFLARTKQPVAAEDRSSLGQEAVVIVELQDTNSHKNIFEHPRLVVGKDQMVQYLCGNLANDLSIIQNEKSYPCNGVQYEGVMGANNNKVR